MKGEKEIMDRLEEIKSDSRLEQPCATIQENAPLAMIQLELESKIAMLKWVLADSKDVS